MLESPLNRQRDSDPPTRSPRRSDVLRENIGNKTPTNYRNAFALALKRDDIGLKGAEAGDLASASFKENREKVKTLDTNLIEQENLSRYSTQYEKNPFPEREPRNVTPSSRSRFNLKLNSIRDVAENGSYESMRQQKEFSPKSYTGKLRSILKEGEELCRELKESRNEISPFRNENWNSRKSSVSKAASRHNSEVTVNTSARFESRYDEESLFSYSKSTKPDSSYPAYDNKSYDKDARIQQLEQECNRLKSDSAKCEEKFKETLQKSKAESQYYKEKYDELLKHRSLEKKQWEHELKDLAQKLIETEGQRMKYIEEILKKLRT